MKSKELKQPNKQLMKTKLIFVISAMLVFAEIQSQSFERGPYTVTRIDETVFHIEDANKSNPSGIQTDQTGKTSGFNNCSDMYLITGRDKILLIDLSNFIKWDTSAVSALRSIVYEQKGKKELYITVTHNHGDHLGMLPAFKEDQDAHFWIPSEEFRGKDIFPAERTVAFPENATLDLGGGVVITSFEVPGHTAHSTIFFLKDRNLLFTGDALGSGNGVWLFSSNSFLAYKESIQRLAKYISDPENKIDSKKLVIYGGHYWQKGKMEKLTGQYIADMQLLIGKIGDGSASEEKTTYNKYLDTNFRYGTATITWNKADAVKYSAAIAR